jgi:hypothetical protein
LPRLALSFSEIDAMHSLDQSLLQLLTALGDVIVALGALLLPFIPLVVWVAYWLFGVNWAKLRVVLLQGGWIGLLLIGFVVVLIWGTVSPPQSGYHHFLGLTVGNFVGKTMLVTTLICIMFLCGSVQLSGFCGSWCQFDEPAAEPAAHADSHGNGSHMHASHGLDSHSRPEPHDGHDAPGHH